MKTDKLFVACYSCQTSHVDADTAKLDTRCPRDKTKDCSLAGAIRISAAAPARLSYTTAAVMDDDGCSEYNP